MELRNISGVSVDAFKRKLDGILKHYPDEPRCSATGVFMNYQGRKSNSLYDLSRNREVRMALNIGMKKKTKNIGGLPR